MSAKQLSVFDTSWEGRPLTTLTIDMVVYLDHPLSRHRDAVLNTLDAFYTLVPKTTLKWYATETTTRDKPCTSRTYDIPKGWWREGAELKEFRFLQIRDGDEYNSVPHAGLRLSCDELEEGKKRPWQPSLVRFMFPAAWAQERSKDLVTLATSVADALPIASGHAGYCIECNRYYETRALKEAHRLAMRYVGVDIDCQLSDEEFEYLKTVNWLTIVGDALLDRLGGRAELRQRLEDSKVRVHDAKHGFVIQAGDQPALGDVNRADLLPAYRAVHAALADLFAPAFTPPFDLGQGDDEGMTETWYRRFEKGGVDAR